jgi:hypothetical protein
MSLGAVPKTHHVASFRHKSEDRGGRSRRKFQGHRRLRLPTDPNAKCSRLRSELRRQGAPPPRAHPPGESPGSAQELPVASVGLPELGSVVNLSARYILGVAMDRPCLFCGLTTGRPSVEDVVPSWARRAFAIEGSLRLYAGERTEDPERRRIAGLPSLKMTLNGAICETCNNQYLSRLEHLVEPILSPMMVNAEPTVLHAHALRLLATWAVKTTLLLELANSQHYAERIRIPGYRATDQELAWLWARNSPPPRSLVWIGCWDCLRTSPLMYEPSGAPLPTRDGYPVLGHFTTIAFGYVVFQVFTVDYVAADTHGARAWNNHVPRSLEGFLFRIWPPSPATLCWPPNVFSNADWPRLVTWDGFLRPFDRPSRTA